MFVGELQISNRKIFLAGIFFLSIVDVDAWESSYTRIYNSSFDNGVASLIALTGVAIIMSSRVKAISAAANAVVAAFVSYAGATSTTSAPINGNPSRPERIVSSSRVDHPPASGVPVATNSVSHEQV